MALWMYSKGWIELPDQRGSLANDIPLQAIEQVNQEFRQNDHHTEHASNS